MQAKLLEVYFTGDVSGTNSLEFTNVTCIKKNFNGSAQPVSSIDELINYKGLLIITSDANRGHGDTVIDLNFVSSISFYN